MMPEPPPRPIEPVAATVAADGVVAAYGIVPAALRRGRIALNLDCN